MTDVFFHGRGDWFLETDNGTRPVTSKINPVYDYSPHNQDLNSEGIFYTNLLFRRCFEFSEVFKLTPSDEKIYADSQSKKILKKTVKKLLPSTHSNSSFLKMVEKGLLSKEDFDRCYFKIQTSVKYDDETKAKDVNFKLKPLNSDNPSNTNSLQKVASHINNPNKSEQLVALNVASEKFWRDADRTDKTTWPVPNSVESWLEKRNFSTSLAKKAASIIRPEWAVSGRRPS